MSAVCEQCIKEPFLQSVVRENLSADECDYCGLKSSAPIACELEMVIEAISAAVDQHFQDPVHEVTYDSQEGGYQAETLDQYEMLDEMGLSLDSDQLWEDIAEHFSENERVPVNFYALNSIERREVGWKRFKEAVTHRRRFTFWTAFDDDQPEFHPDYLPTAHMLGEIAEALSTVGNVRKVLAGARYWRVRVHSPEESLAAASDFAAPQSKHARYSNRMSPAGVAMFYGAADFETAVIETFQKDRAGDKVATGAAFATCADLELLDLCNIPDRPSLFDPAVRDVHDAIVFLRHFRDDLIRPITKDGREHVEYVPTQVFTEFVRYELKYRDRQGLDGIIYPSSRNRHECVVLFVSHEQCLDVVHFRRGPQRLRFDASSLKTVEHG